MESPFIPLRLPPGVSNNGTEYENKGRYTDIDLVRWRNKRLRPIGGWASLATEGGIIRRVHTWSDDLAVSRAALGSSEGLSFVTTAGAVTDISPIGWSNIDASASWSFGDRGERLLAINTEDGDLLSWIPGETEASVLSNAPQGKAVVMTNEEIPLLLGSGGYERRIAWPDPDDLNDWTPGFVSLAGSLDVQSSGVLLDGIKVRGGTLVLTTDDIHLLQFVGKPFIYGRDIVGSDCGLISPGALAGDGNNAWWMGEKNFYRWVGYMEPIACEIQDSVFDNINLTRAKITARAIHLHEFNEVWFLYPDGVNTENNRAAVYNYREKFWMHHTLARSAGAPSGKGFDYPLMVTSGGTVYEHEKEFSDAGCGYAFC